jgi:nucleotide-binding universal stress UspA family protein
MLRIRTILHPTDFSKHSDYAFQLACSLARDYGARLIIVHVAEPPLPIYGEGLVLPPPQVPKEPLLAKLDQLLPQDPKLQAEHRLLEGDAATGIRRAAQESKCDLIVMGTHGRTGLGRLLMGSVAEQVVRTSSCPVLTVKTPPRPASSSEGAIAVASRKGEAATK